MENKLISMNDLVDMFGVSRSTMAVWVDEEKFPKSIRIGERTRRWKESEVIEWMEERRDSNSNDVIEN